MEYDAIIFEGSGLTDYADTAKPSIVLTNLTVQDVDVLFGIAAKQKELVVCFLPHKENG